MIESKIEDLPQEHYPSYNNPLAYMEPCREFTRFRELLDATGIEWHDASDLNPICPLHRTHGEGFSVIWGAVSFGREFGLLEAKLDGMEEVGHLTAEDAFNLCREKLWPDKVAVSAKKAKKSKE